MGTRGCVSASTASSCAREPSLEALWILSALPFTFPHRLSHLGLM